MFGTVLRKSDANVCKLVWVREGLFPEGTREKHIDDVKVQKSARCRNRHVKLGWTKETIIQFVRAKFRKWFGVVHVRNWARKVPIFSP